MNVDTASARTASSGLWHCCTSVVSCAGRDPSDSFSLVEFSPSGRARMRMPGRCTSFLVGAHRQEVFFSGAQHSCRLAFLFGAVAPARQPLLLAVISPMLQRC